MKRSERKKLEREQREANRVSFAEMAAAEEELKQVKAEYGIKDDYYIDRHGNRRKKRKNPIAMYFDHQDNRVKVTVPKRTYILLLLFTGWAGGHRFYVKMWPTAILYLALCWTGFSMAMSVIDLMVVIPMKKDENGMITI